MKGQLRVYYDEEADFIEIRVNEPRENYGDEIEDDMVLFRDEKTDEIVGIGIFNFKKRCSDFQELKLDLPVDIGLFSKAV